MLESWTSSGPQISSSFTMAADAEHGLDVYRQGKFTTEVVASRDWAEADLAHRAARSRVSTRQEAAEHEALGYLWLLSVAPGGCPAQ